MVTRAEHLDTRADQELVARFLEGDETAFVEIVRAHYPSLLAQARRRLRALSDADDAVQETFLRAYRAIERFGGDYHLRAWLGRILSNVCTDVANRHQSEFRLRERLARQRPVVAPVDELIDDHRVNKAVRQAMASLPPSHRQALVLRDLEERSYAEVASVMAITEVNARARVSRARATLQRSLQGLSGVLGTVFLPIRVLASSVVGAGSRSGRLSTLAASGTDGFPVPAAVPSMTGQMSLVTGQLANQVTATPLVQAASNALPEVARASLPAASTLVTLAAGALAAVAPSAITPVTPVPLVAVHVAQPPVGATPGAQDDVAVSLASTATPDDGSSATPVVAAATTTISSTTAWTWVKAAGDGSAAAAASDSSSPPTGDAGTTTTTSSPSLTSGQPAADATPCPWLSALTGAGSDPITLPAPLGDTTGYAETFVMSNVTLTTTGPSFVGASIGALTDQDGNTSSLHALFGACLPGTTSPVLVVNLTDPSAPQVAEVQLRGAMVSSSSGDGETDLLYRGVASALGADASATASVPFVADLSLLEPANTMTLEVAFLSALPGFGDSNVTTGSVSSGSASPGPTGDPTDTQGSSTAPAVTSDGTTVAASGQGQGVDRNPSPAPPTSPGTSPTDDDGQGPDAPSSSPGAPEAPGATAPADPPVASDATPPDGGSGPSTN